MQAHLDVREINASYFIGKAISKTKKKKRPSSKKRGPPRLNFGEYLVDVILFILL